MAVHFHTDSISFDLKNKRSIKTWIKKVIEEGGYKTGNLNFIFCSDEKLYSINVERLNHYYYTDIITFDLSEEQQLIEGDIFISVDRVSDNAEKLKVEFDDELHRVMIHGVLHLLGFQDKTGEQKQVMRMEEDRALDLFSKFL